MGPTALFDKSFLQSLSVDESVWFDRFFNATICPLFYIETLGDLEKPVAEGRTSENEVRAIAEKTPTMSGMPCAFHGMLVLEDIFGNPPPMTGQVPVAGGRMVRVEGKVGAIFDESPEAKAFSRWQRMQFAELDREAARDWRQVLRATDLRSSAEALRSHGIDGKSCRTFEQAKGIAESLLLVRGGAADRLRLALTFLGIHPSKFWGIQQVWNRNGRAPLTVWAPYAAHVAMVEAFMHVALASRLISEEVASNRTDIAYLFYLPFCSVFVSSDRLHRNCAPFFMRADQEFIWGQSLKQDLGSIDAHFASLPDDIKERGIQAFARDPPDGTLVAGIWDRQFPGWRERSREQPPSRPAKDRDVIERHNAMRSAPAIDPRTVPRGSERLDMVSIERLVTKQKGKWWQLPKNLQTDGTSEPNSTPV
jgi:hypothetical protein